MADPFPKQLLLSEQDVQTILGITSRSTWKRFQKSEDWKKFPPPISMGTLESGKPRLMWRKYEVLAFITMKNPASKSDQNRPNVTKTDQSEK